MRIALIGAGALGSELALLLAKSQPRDVASVLVIDPDRMEPRNIALSRVYSRVYSGVSGAVSGASCYNRYKADLLAATMATESPAAWSAHNVEIADVGWGVLRECDLLVSCTDNALARVETAAIARTLRIPVVDAGVMSDHVPEGRVSWFSPALEAACYLCGVGEAKRADLLAYVAAPSLGCQPQGGIPHGNEFSGVPSAIRETAALAAETVFQFSVAGGDADTAWAPSSWAKKVVEAEGHWRIDSVQLSRSVTCPLHGGEIRRLLALRQDTPLRDALLNASAAAGGWRLQLAWPICVSARCRICGERHDRAHRLAALRRRAVCEHCGSVAQLDPLRCLADIGADDPEASFTPRELGLPDRYEGELRRSLYPCATGAEAR